MLRRLFGRGRNDSQRAEQHTRQVHDGLDSGIEFDHCTFSVVDVETTGLFPQTHDRIIEIAIVQIRPDGRVLDEFATLLNPDRDLGATHIHGITAREVLDAPRFHDIAGDVISRLADNVLVAHNARFDVGFLEAEFERMGHHIPPLASVCTLNLARKLSAPASSYRLGSLCDHYNIPLEGAHAALEDARATASLLCTFLGEARSKQWRTLADLGYTEQPASLREWPPLQQTGRVHTRKHAALSRSEPSYLARLADRLATAPDRRDSETLEYEDLLDRVLEDRRVTKEEADALLQVASRWGLSAPQVRAVHDMYFKELVRIALEDGIITETERRDLSQVTELLGHDAADLNSFIKTARTTTLSGHRIESADSLSSGESLAGLSVCFTGESRCTLGGERISRDRAEELAIQAGLAVQHNVTKALGVLVVADPHSLSTKAKKAQRYGTRIMAEAVFWRAIGLNVD